MDDPDQGWKPNNRPQSTVARNFMSELDDLFRLDDNINDLDKTVAAKKQAVTTHSQELEALEAKLRATEERLKLAKTSPPRRKDSQRRTPIEGSFAAEDKARLDSGSPLARRQKENVAPRPVANMPANGEKA
ncbi:hypothetical protein P280DRAFT_403231 [Massarina eburnea CBS 473.64]|uniref:Uncharacterized protein n=1 Tax=Massarina eburnea CBS 473.64 TaxID=1395130 RepID=A0A6A6RUZ6_9PLEO|nr:hypothetical protein P280DRAFT_403231 [Massarina eburnea CBS 473.64]